MASRIVLKAVNAELERRGHHAVVGKGDGYFYFTGGKAANWLDNTVRLPTLSALTLDEWMNEFTRLKKLNAEIIKANTPKQAQ